MREIGRLYMVALVMAALLFCAQAAASLSIVSARAAEALPTGNEIMIGDDEVCCAIDAEHFPDPNFRAWVKENCPEGFDPKYIRMSYHRQSLLGDVLIPHYGAGEHETTGALKRDEQVCCAFYFSDEIPKECLAVFDKENNK